jgi:hypothetical protein
MNVCHAARDLSSKATASLNFFFGRQTARQRISPPSLYTSHVATASRHTARTARDPRSTHRYAAHTARTQWPCAHASDATPQIESRLYMPVDTHALGARSRLCTPRSRLYMPTKTPRVQHGLLPVEKKGYTCQLRRLASNMAYCLLRKKAIHANSDASRPTWLIAC